MSPSSRLADRLRLMVVTDPQCSEGRTVVDVCRAAIAGGATAIQLRWKEAPGRRQVELGRVLRRLTRETDILFLVNDRLDVALCVEADGVHLGEDDLPVRAARSVGGEGLVIGWSADSEGVARAGVGEGADYLGVGPMYATDTKSDAGAPVGPDRVRRIAASAGTPVVGIGGITADGASAVAGAGAAGVAVVSAVMRAPDPAAAAAGILAAMDAARG